MNEHLEVKVLPSGKAVARRRDGLPLTDGDRDMARKLADALRVKHRGITLPDLLRVFPGARIVEQPIDEPKPSCCSHCDRDSIPSWRRGGKIVQHTAPDRNRYWACHYCGRRGDSEKKSRTMHNKKMNAK